MIAGIYCRVSTEDQAREGTSLDTQLEACLLKAREAGYEVSDELIFRESFSGLTLQRPRLSELRAKANSGEIDALIVYTPDRLARVGEDILSLAKEFKLAGVKLLFVKEQWDDTLNGKLIAFILGWASEFEAAQIKERTNRGRKARIKSGKLANGQASYLYGYRYVVGEGKRQIDPETSKVVQDIFRWFTEEGLPLDHIIYRLRDLGILSPSSKHMWARATVWKMLKQPAYASDAFTPGIIDQTTLDKAQARLRYNALMASRNLKREYLLRGHLFCQHCGRRYQGALKHYRTQQGLKEYEYYRCSASHRIYAEPCHNPAWKAQELDNTVWREVENILSNPQMIMKGVEAAKDDSGILAEQLAQCNKRLKEINNQQEQLLQWALKGFPGETIAKENERLNQDRLGLIQHKGEIEARLNEVKESQVKLEDVQQALATVKANLSQLSFEQKRLALSALGIKVLVDKNFILIEGNVPLGVIASTPSNRNGERIPSISACQPTQPE